MEDTPKKLVSRGYLVYLFIILLGLACYQLYRDYHEVGGWERSNLIYTAATFCIGLLVLAGVAWYANRPEREDKK